MRFSGWSTAMSESLSQFVFSVALPAMLFRLMSDFSKLPPVDARLLIAFFGGCLVVFAIGRLIAWKLFALDGVSQSVFALGGIFSNNLLLGLPLAKVALGDAAVPSVALVLVFNALILWTLVSVSIEWARNGSVSTQGFVKTLRSVLRNPIVAAISISLALLTIARTRSLARAHFAAPLKTSRGGAAWSKVAPNLTIPRAQNGRAGTQCAPARSAVYWCRLVLLFAPMAAGKPANKRRLPPLTPSKPFNFSNLNNPRRGL